MFPGSLVNASLYCSSGTANRLHWQRAGDKSPTEKKHELIPNVQTDLVKQRLARYTFMFPSLLPSTALPHQQGSCCGRPSVSPSAWRLGCTRSITRSLVVHAVLLQQPPELLEIFGQADFWSGKCSFLALLRQKTTF